VANAFTRHMDEQNRPRTQREKADPRQVANNEGGFVFQVTNDTRLERFLVLGTAGGTYYQDEQELTKQNVDWLIQYIQTNPSNCSIVLRKAEQISQEGRAFRNSPAIFTLALLFKYGHASMKQELATRSVLRICRTATHLYELCDYFELMGGWNRTKRAAVANWYLSKSADQVAYQAVKYRQRNGWTHRDLLRLSHPKGLDPQVGNFILGKDSTPVPGVSGIEIINGFKSAQLETSLPGLLSVLGAYPNLPWEALPTQFHKEPDVWKKLFYNGSLTGQALVRNITRLARIGAFGDMVFAADYAAKLVDEEMIARTRLHPINYLNALVVHNDGQVIRKTDKRTGRKYTEGRRRDWERVSVIRDALDAGFYAAFKYVEPANKRTQLAVDVSSSMSWGFAGGLDFTAAQVAAAMAMTIARSEPYHQIMGFAANYKDLGISARTSIPEAMRIVQNQNFGGTDCALPMVRALENKKEVDTFVVITDGETWAGRIHPFQALRNYRQQMGIDARLAVVAVTSTGFTIADPSDSGMLDVVGADENLPRLISEFSAGRV
jgi:60 kDa SS-A/Ro ribonucleoprotein